MRSLRTSIDQVHLADSDLAYQLTVVSRDIEECTLSFSPKSNVDDGESDLKGMDLFGHLVVQRRKLLDDREKLISQIRDLPGFENFLRPSSFETLRSAARHGPVIIINHSKWRSDIVILVHNSFPSLIPTCDNFYVRANELQDRLVREGHLDSDEYDYALRSVLEELYDLVGLPVIRRLHELKVPEQSRVWWCPTSVFCSLPLHAMGPIPSDQGPVRYFQDLYISSYTPSLSALIESGRPSSQAINKPSILLVAYPDDSLYGAWDEVKTVQAVDTQVTTLISSRATPTAVLARLGDHPFAHIVGHGTLEPGEPFKASFKLHREQRLQLLDIVRSQLPNAEFAFLSACHSAELTAGSIADEMLHLSTAMQFCGFRSVIGTMWAMGETDGRDVAKYFYDSVFSDKAQEEVHYYERMAEALRDAVQKLRTRKKDRMSLERWVKFVHYGA